MLCQKSGGAPSCVTHWQSVPRILLTGFILGSQKNVVSFQVEDSGNNSPGDKRAATCPDWPFICLLAYSGALEALLLRTATMVVNILILANPLAPKLGTEPRTLDSDVTLLPFDFFYLGPFHTFLLPSGTFSTTLLSTFYSIFQCQLKKFAS